jgi:hypothetical protein
MTDAEYIVRRSSIVKFHTENITILSSTQEGIFYRKKLGKFRKTVDSNNMT